MISRVENIAPSARSELIQISFFGITLLYLLLIGCLSWILRQRLGRELKSLYKLQSWLKSFHPGNSSNLPLDNPSAIDEFKTLSEIARESVCHYDKLYTGQKQFAENAAIELSEPLAACFSQVDDIISENDMERRHKELKSLRQALGGVIRLNDSLLALSRIESMETLEPREIYMNDLIHETLREINELYEDKALHLRFTEKESLVCTMNYGLARLLIDKLLKNAYVHNTKEGRVEIVTTRDTLIISNTGADKLLDDEFLTRRFTRRESRETFGGEGLAIVRSITELYSIQIRYEYKEGMHHFTLSFH